MGKKIMFIVTSDRCSNCMPFKENYGQFKRTWKRYGGENLKVVEIPQRANDSFDPGEHSSNLSMFVSWLPCIIVLDRKEYEASRGSPGYKYRRAWVYGTKYRRGDRIKTPKTYLTPDGFARFLDGIFSKTN